MDVCDINGDKIGSVARVYRHELSAVAAGGATGAEMPGTPRPDIVEVKTGFMGLGRHLYVPTNAIHDVTQGCVFLSKSKGDIDNLDWATRPDYLDELT
jgi:hypothetical protein